MECRPYYHLSYSLSFSLIPNRYPPVSTVNLIPFFSKS
ncbi:hypothetical protein T11_9855 [Trichinella zimbabwensis]|uniref:Uncharacterized protein n=1 Tax=Trichinella zimbabwensis TaxID=268475 RepID=A0A0V1GGA9_9BILA|nr:hypothetical protein T11_9855 [Trichinella zimbabwensis]